MGEPGTGSVWLAPPSKALIGRTAPLAVLERSLDEALDGRPPVVLVEGEAGIGKTRLVTELLRPPVVVVRSRSSVAVAKVSASRTSRWPTALAPLGDDLGAAVRLLDPRRTVPLTSTRRRTSGWQHRSFAACAAPRCRCRRATPRCAPDRRSALGRPPHGRLFEQLVTTALLAGGDVPSTGFLIVATMRSPPEHVATIVERLRGESGACRSVCSG